MPGKNGDDGVTVNLALGTATDTFGNHETLVSIENIRGSRCDDDHDRQWRRKPLDGLSRAMTRSTAATGAISSATTGRDNGGDGWPASSSICRGSDFTLVDADPDTYGEAGDDITVLAGNARDGYGDTDTLSNIEDIRGTGRRMTS